MPAPPSPRPRRRLQIALAALVVVIGALFTLWVSAHMTGRVPPVDRPPGVEGFLPIGAMLAVRHWMVSGEIHTVHPAAMAILLAVLASSLVVAKAFCSHLCPVGFVSEMLGRFGERVIGRRVDLPRWADVPLRGLKYLLLGFFLWAVWWAMDARAVAAFLDSPYYRVSDAKMWLFFADPSRTTLVVLASLVALSVVVRDAWCRYLCPYGALVGLVGLLAPLRVRRDANACTSCRACTRACPARLPVHRLARVTSPECTSCQDCVVACPVKDCLAVRPPRRPAARRRPRALRPATAAVLVAATFFAIVGGFRAAGWWHSSVPEAELAERIESIDEPRYNHDAALEEARDDGAAAGQRGSMSSAAFPLSPQKR